MRKHFYICLICALFLNTAFNQTKERKRDIVEFEFIIDSSTVLEFENRLKVGVISKLRNGKEKLTPGFLKSWYSWKNFNINVTNGEFKKGIISFDRASVIKNGSTLKLNIYPAKSKELEKEILIDIPYAHQINILIDKKAKLAQGFTIPIYLEAKYTNGKTYSTKEYLNGYKLIWQDFIVTINEDTLRNAYINIPKEADNIIDSLRIKAKNRFLTDISSDIVLAMNYKADYWFNFDGKNGYSGADGKSAPEVSSGDGLDGEDGDSGGDGTHAKDIIMFVEADYLGEDTLLKISAFDNIRKEGIVINADGGSLYIQSNGGNGGYGGYGGCGSNGSDETEDEEAGTGGDGGDGGHGGNGGNGGDIIIYADSVAGYFLDRISVKNIGGYGGKGGVGGAKGKGGTKTSGKKGWTFVGNVLGVRNGLNGRNGYNGNDGKNGTLNYYYVAEDEIIRKKAKLQKNIN